MTADLSGTLDRISDLESIGNETVFLSKKF